MVGGVAGFMGVVFANRGIDLFRGSEKSTFDNLS
jgi:hypothetical protein